MVSQEVVALGQEVVAILGVIFVTTADDQPSCASSAGIAETLRRSRGGFAAPKAGMPSVIQSHRQRREVTSPPPGKCARQPYDRRPIRNLITDGARAVQGTHNCSLHLPMLSHARVADS